MIVRLFKYQWHLVKTEQTKSYYGQLLYVQLLHLKYQFTIELKVNGFLFKSNDSCRKNQIPSIDAMYNLLQFTSYMQTTLNVTFSNLNHKIFKIRHINFGTLVRIIFWLLSKELRKHIFQMDTSQCIFTTQACTVITKMEN